MEHQRGAAEGPLNTHTHTHTHFMRSHTNRHATAGVVLHQRRKKKSENQLGLSCSSHTRLTQSKELTNTHTQSLMWTGYAHEPIRRHSRIQDDQHHGGLMCPDTAFYSLQRRWRIIQQPRLPHVRDLFPPNSKGNFSPQPRGPGRIKNIPQSNCILKQAGHKEKRLYRKDGSLFFQL